MMANACLQRDLSALKRRSRGRTCSWADADDCLDEHIAVKIESDDDLSTGSTIAADDTSSKRFSDSSEDSAGPHASSEEESPKAAATMPVPFVPPAGGVFPSMPMMTPMSPMASGLQMFYMMSMAPNGQQMLVPMRAAGMPPAMMHMQQMPVGMAMMPGGMAMMPMQQAPATGSGTGDLEAHATALAVHAQEVSAAAKRARVALQAARQAGRGGAAKAQPAEASRGDEPQVSADQRTTLMFRNLPSSFTRSRVSAMLDKEGFKGAYCFIYVPTDFKKFTSFGYAFVGFNRTVDAVRAKQHFQGFDGWDSSNTCDVAWSGPVQGLEQHTERYRNSPVMHPSVPDEYKPAVYVSGERAEFPAPTKRLRPPRLRHGVASEMFLLDQQAA